MSPPEVWGPPVWTFFHVLAEKVNENIYPRVMGQMFDVIKRICSGLPCPECARDANDFLGRVKLNDLKTKNDFKNMVYLFHNYVNAKKRKQLYNYLNLEIYKNYNILVVFNRFISVYHTKGNMRLLSESFQRQFIVRDITNWFRRNLFAFIPGQQPPTNTEEQPILTEEQPILTEEQPILTEEQPIEQPTITEEQVEKVIVVESSGCCGNMKIG